MNFGQRRDLAIELMREKIFSDHMYATSSLLITFDEYLFTASKGYEEGSDYSFHITFRRNRGGAQNVRDTLKHFVDSGRMPEHYSSFVELMDEKLVAFDKKYQKELVA